MGMRQWRTVNEAHNPFKIRERVNHLGQIEVDYTQTNMDEVLEVNREMQREERSTSSIWNGRETVHVARIPEELIHDWFREGINFYRGNEDDRARLLQKLNDPAYAHLRTDDPSLKI